MRLRATAKLLLGAVVFATAQCPTLTWACAACFGKSDSPMAQGMNMGIFSLLAVIVSVLAGVAGFFIYLACRGARVSSHESPTAAVQEPISTQT